jgi:hypothetical protein
MCFWRRVSVHHVRAHTPRFASGGDEYLLIFIVEGFKVRAIALPAAALAALAIAIVAFGTCCVALTSVPLLSRQCSRVPFAHGPHRLYYLRLHARCY